jgi:hypothetical protein
MTDTSNWLNLIDPVVAELLSAFDVDRPPVPVELMLQRPREGMWPEIDLSEMSATFLNLFDRYAPRMSAVRLLSRNVARSQWGRERDLGQMLEDGELLNLLSRAIIMPRHLLEVMDLELRDPEIISLKFEVPLEDARLRLVDLGYLEG